MKTLTQSLETLDKNYLEALKAIQRNLDINLEMLKLSKFDPTLYGEAIAVEDSINAFEVLLKEEAIITIAKFQPAAKNLRELIMLINSARLVERMGDLLKANLLIIKEVENKTPLIASSLSEDILPAATKIKKIYEMYMEAFINADVKLLYNILYLDEEIDNLINKNSNILLSKIKENPEIIEGGSSLMLLNRKFERISDHIIHLASDLIYIINGENTRKKELFGSDKD